MRQKLPESGKEMVVEIAARKENNIIIIEINLPNNTEVFVWNNKKKFSNKYRIKDGEILIENASDISKIAIDAGPFSDDTAIRTAMGEKNRNLTGAFIKYHPICGNHIQYECLL